jgi:SAM-dependent methyltransferase
MKHMLAAIALCVLGAAQAQPRVVEEVPFITSPDNVTLEMLRLASVGPGDHVIDLGSGDGRIVILAARRFGASGLGVEIDPRLVQESRRNAAQAGVADRAEFREQDLFRTDLSTATVVTMYLLPEVNLQLRPSLLALKPGTRVVSHDWDMGDWKPDASTVVPVPDKKVGLEKFSRIHLWVVPAKVEGLWCGPGAQMELKQAYQEVDARVTRDGTIRQLQGRMQGTRLQLGNVTYEVDGNRLRASDQAFTRAAGVTTCGRRTSRAAAAGGRTGKPAEK